MKISRHKAVIIKLWPYIKNETFNFRDLSKYTNLKSKDIHLFKKFYLKHLNVEDIIKFFGYINNSFLQKNIDKYKIRISKKSSIKNIEETIEIENSNKKLAKCGHFSTTRYFKCEKCLPTLPSEPWYEQFSVAVPAM